MMSILLIAISADNVDTMKTPIVDFVDLFHVQLKQQS